uniref:21 kDa protein n=1 Tax=Noccaea caerulescens TaxID=107243 RepID=A0A1J3FZ99_NOCCA
MAKQYQTLFLILSISYLFSSDLTAANAASPAGVSKKAVNFIQSSCKATTYPAVCFNSLSAYANAIQTSPKRLAETALAVTLSRAQSTKLFVSRLTRFKGLKKREVEAIHDCAEEINDTIDRLNKSIQELKLCGSAKNQDQFSFHMSNAQTWTSAALTDENTCSDGFSGRFMDGRIKNSVRAKIVNVGQETSNALSLINAYAKKY